VNATRKEVVGCDSDVQLTKPEPFTQQALHLGGRRVRMLAANAFPGDIATQFVQFQGDGKAFLPGHPAVTQNLFVQIRLWCHATTLPRRAPPVNAGKLRAVRQVSRKTATSPIPQLTRLRRDGVSPASTIGV